MLKLVNPHPLTGGYISPISFISFNKYIFFLNVIKNTYKLWSNIVEVASPAAATIIVIIRAILYLILLLQARKFRILDEESLPYNGKLMLDKKKARLYL